MKPFVACAVAFILIPLSGFAQPVHDLQSELERGNVTLVQIRGTGNSTGHVLDGYVINETDADRYISVELDPALFFVNSGAGQNMIAMSLYMRDGGYLSDGRRSFIRLRAGERTPVTFSALCVDFDKENPVPAETLIPARLPASLIHVLERIREYMREHPDKDVLVPAQLALWQSQGISREAISERFESTLSDRLRAREILRDPPPR